MIFIYLWNVYPLWLIRFLHDIWRKISLLHWEIYTYSVLLVVRLCHLRFLFLVRGILRKKLFGKITFRFNSHLPTTKIDQKHDFVIIQSTESKNSIKMMGKVTIIRRNENILQLEAPPPSKAMVMSTSLDGTTPYHFLKELMYIVSYLQMLV